MTFGLLSHVYLPWVNSPFNIVSISVLNMKLIVGAFNQEALVGAFTMIVKRQPSRRFVSSSRTYSGRHLVTCQHDPLDPPPGIMNSFAIKRLARSLSSSFLSAAHLWQHSGCRRPPPRAHLGTSHHISHSHLSILKAFDR